MFILAAQALADPVLAKPLFPGLVLRTGSYPNSLAAGDFNHDGITDLVVTNESIYSLPLGIHGTLLE